jgi:phospholipid-binding lipoprotein MlaA
MIRRRTWAAAALLALLAGCASVPTDPAARAAYRATDDPLEPMNRRIFAFNLEVDRRLIRPIAREYVRLLPPAARDALRNFLQNLREPVVLANDLLQGGFRRAGRTADRFLVNSTFGIAGGLDLAARHGVPEQTGDFGQTLHVWGFPAGPYLVIPVAGPSNPRDAVGSGIDLYLDPFRYVAQRNNFPTGLSVAETAARGIDERSRNLGELAELQRDSIDYYAAFRSLYRQHRAAELGGPRALPSSPAEDLDPDPGDPARPPGLPGGSPAP